MSNEIAVSASNVVNQTSLFPAELLGESKWASNADLESMMSKLIILPRIQVFGSNSELVKSGKFPLGHFGLVIMDKLSDLGKQFNCVPAAVRPFALDMSDKDNMIVVYNQQHPEFERIREVADDPDNKGKMTGHMYGPQFLLWLPDQNMFAAFFCYNASLRFMAPMLARLKNQATTMAIRYVEKKFSWHSAEAYPCSTPITNLPDFGLLKATVDEFNNPPETNVELAAPAVAGSEERVV